MSRHKKHSDMKIYDRLFNWYFRRGALPYWCIVAFDFSLCLLGGLAVARLRLPASEMLAECPRLMRTFLAFGAINLAGFRVFRTYAGILRYSQFVDLLRVVYAGAASFAAAAAFSLAERALGGGGFFYPLALGTVALVYMATTALMCGARVLVKLAFEGAKAGGAASRTLIYGTHAGAIALTNSARNEKPTKFLIEGYIGDSKPHYKETLMGKRIYSTREDIAGVIRKKRIGVVMVSPLKHAAFMKNRAFQDELLNAGVRIYVSQNAEEWNRNKDPRGKIGMREVRIEDLLPREEIQVDMESIGGLLRGRKVLITGSAGSIGSEMARQIAAFAPAEMVLIDQAETPQHDMRLMMRDKFPTVRAHAVVTSICREDRMEEIFRDFRPDYVFHAAAYKHVPMMEDNPSESVQNNVRGTQVIADLSVRYGVRKFVMISTDKAVNPTNVMGCSKRICEIYVQSLDRAEKEGRVKGSTQFVTTRFGNVLGSNGSVIPLFREQLAKGGPLTVTHPDIIRFFMLIPEACKLVLEAGTHGRGGEIFVFDMGEPVRIADLARRMIRLSGAKGVEIRYTGLREGEKLYEEVLSENEGTLPSFNRKIRIAMVRDYDYGDVRRELDELYETAARFDDMETVRKMKEIVPEYVSRHSRYEALDGQRGRRAEDGGEQSPRGLHGMHKDTKTNT